MSLSDKTGIIYKCVNNIKDDSLHPKYKELASHDGEYYGSTDKKTVEARYHGDPLLKTHNPLLKRAVEIFGRENFSYEIVEEEVPLKDLWRREAEWIEISGSLHPNGYNLKKGSTCDWKRGGGEKYRLVRNVKTNKVFEVPSLKAFSRKPEKYDKDWDGITKVNYTQISNAFTGYIPPAERKQGHDTPHKLLCSATYCPAKYTLADLKRLENYKYKHSYGRHLEDLTYPFTLINVRTLCQFSFLNAPEMGEFLWNRKVRLSSFRKAKGCKSSEWVDKKTLNNYPWWHFDEKGEYNSFTLIDMQTKEEFQFTWDMLDSLAQKLLKRKKGVGGYICSLKEQAHSTFGRSIRSLVSGRIKTAYGLRLKEEDVHVKVRLMRFKACKKVKELQNRGYKVYFG